MNLKQIHYFIVVCDQRSLSGAADVLGVAQPTISRQVQLLEAELRQHLLRRTGRGVEPTEAGLRFLNHAKGINSLAAKAKQDLLEFRSSMRGKVRLGLPPRIARRLTPHIVREFRRLLPDSSITIAEGLSTVMREWIIGDRVDLALLYEPPRSVLMSCETIFREELVLAYTQGAKPAPPKHVRVADLARFPLVLPSAPNTIRDLVDHTCRDLGVNLNIVAEVDVVHSIVETTAQGNVFTIIPRSAIKDLVGHEELAYSHIGEPTIKNNLTLALPINGSNKKLASATADIIRSLDLIEYLS
ncbi:LysR family transcriptional regulator [Parapusillimonas sp. SGNA-6]|jgi:LysR family nitrogen assimilation transcriptional regulator|nr:LysR family transcriptional regulator [Parapusillimonas sp. SGNA-6]